MSARAITKALGGKWAGRYGLARCPAHGDKIPSLKIRDDARKGIDVHCFAGCDWKDIKNELRRQGLLSGSFSADIRPRAPAENEHKNIAPALSLWRGSEPLPGTLGEIYFTERRGLKIGDLEHAVRYHPVHRMIVALMTDAISNEPIGVHRIFLDADGKKRDRKMLGRQGVVRLSPDEEVTLGLGIAEGVEDALAILTERWAPVWAATSAGAIERFPVLPGIDCITVFADTDDPGMRAAEACAARWFAAGHEARVSQL